MCLLSGGVLWQMAPILISVKPVLFKIPIRGIASGLDESTQPQLVLTCNVSIQTFLCNLSSAISPRNCLVHASGDEVLLLALETFVTTQLRSPQSLYTFADLLNTLGMHCRCRAVKIHTISGNNHQWLWQKKSTEINRSKSNSKEVKTDSQFFPTLLAIEKRRLTRTRPHHTEKPYWSRYSLGNSYAVKQSPQPNGRGESAHSVTGHSPLHLRTSRFYHLFGWT